MRENRESKRAHTTQQFSFHLDVEIKAENKRTTVNEDDRKRDKRTNQQDTEML